MVFAVAAAFVVGWLTGAMPGNKADTPQKTAKTHVI
jgi:hypothetical protein